MIVNRQPTNYPRRGGPSCMVIVAAFFGITAFVYLSANWQTVSQAIIPTPTPEPTRSADSFALSASLYQRDGEYNQAIEMYENAIVLSPENPNYYVELVNLLTLEGNAADALLWAERVNILAPDNDSVLTSVSSAYLLNGTRLAEIGERQEADLQYQRAIDTARQATQINPNNATAYAYLAGALVQQNRDNFPEAQELIDTALLIDTESSTVHYYRGVVFETQGYYQEAIESYEVATDLNAAYVDASLALAYNYFYTDNRQRAIIVLRDLIEANNSNADAHDALGWMYFLAGQYPEAETYLEDAVVLDPEMIRARAHLGATYFRQFNYEAAVPELESAIATYDGPSETNSLFYNMLGFAYYRLDTGLCTQAEPLFEQVLEIAGPDTFNGQNAQQGLEDCRQARLGINN